MHKELGGLGTTHANRAPLPSLLQAGGSDLRDKGEFMCRGHQEAATFFLEGRKGGWCWASEKGKQKWKSPMLVLGISRWGRWWPRGLKPAFVPVTDKLLWCPHAAVVQGFTCNLLLKSCGHMPAPTSTPCTHPAPHIHTPHPIPHTLQPLSHIPPVAQEGCSSPACFPGRITTFFTVALGTSRREDSSSGTQPGWVLRSPRLGDNGTHHVPSELAQPQQGKSKVDTVAGDSIVLQHHVHGCLGPLLQGGCIQPLLHPQHLGRAPCPQEVALTVLGHDPCWGRS